MLPFLTYLLVTITAYSNGATIPVAPVNASIKTDISVPSPPLNFDFSYYVDPCNPLTVRFTSIGTVNTDPYWDLGDGTIVKNQLQISHTYTVPGNYRVRHSVAIPAQTDTLNKNISINFTIENVLLTKDTVICNGDTKKLRSVPALEYCWSPATGLDNSQAAEPVLTANQDITYFLNAKIASNTNLITNGDFSQGNIGFTSTYSHATPNVAEAQYFVGKGPKNWNTNFGYCIDHTTGGGNLMMVNGAPDQDEMIWSETITVNPNTNYAFSTWIENLAFLNPAVLQFAINGIPLGGSISAGNTTCVWKQFFTTWNSGNNTTATISIINKNVIRDGNDFALDDIFFSEIFIKRDSVKITVDKPAVKTRADTTICPRTPIQLFATGAATYSWTPSTDLSSASIANPIATTANPVQYIVTGKNAKGCKASDTVNISVYKNQFLYISPTQTICKNTRVELMASGGVAYDWFPTQTLNNPQAGTLMASPKENTLYYVDITDVHSCVYRDSVQVNIRPDPIFAVKGGGNLCLNDTMQLQASGGDIYSWEPETGLINPASPNPLASPSTTTDYMVTILETACNQSTVLPVKVKVLPLPRIKAAKDFDINCFNDRSQLNVKGGGVYSWKPIATLTNPGIANPVARPLVTTTYIVKGTDGWGCSNYDSVLVKVDLASKAGYLMPNAFTPNNDGHNDCYGVKYWGTIDKIEFSIFDQWGHRVFFTRDPNQCWDGKVNGKDQAPGVFVYMVKASTVCEPDVFRKGTFVLIR